MDGATRPPVSERRARRAYDDGTLQVQGASITLRPLTPRHVGTTYRAWLNDPEITRYLEARFQRWSLAGLRRFVAQVRTDPRTWFFGIFLAGEGRMVGTIKLGPVERAHGTAEVGLLVGERALHGRGIGSEAIALASGFGVGALGLRKLTAGAYQPNQASVRAFEKAGWHIEAVIPRQCLLDAEPVGVVRMARYNEAWDGPHGGTA